MGHTLAIRYRFVTLLILGGATSVLSLFALVRALGLAETHRVERARDAVVTELEELAATEPSADALAGPPATSFVGLRGGWTARGDHPTISVPAPWRGPLVQVLRRAQAEDGPVVDDVPMGSQTLVVAARPGRNAIAWTGFMVEPSGYLRPWRWVTIALLGVTALLVVVAVTHAVTFRNGAQALRRALAGLARDLDTPVPKVSVRELRDIGDGIGKLAADLSAARDARERMAGELALKERLAALGRVVAGVAHEVRNPLASIKLRLDLAGAGAALSDSTRASIEAASREITRLDRLVGDLLLVAGKRLGPLRRTDLGALVRARVENLAPWAEAKGVAVRVEGAGSAEADPESLARALDNLVRNAVEAAPSGTEVVARVAGADGDAVAITVSDRGAGVAPARAGELFEPFFTTKAGGTGLGLAVSRAIARAHGGDLRYARAGEVTEFTMVVPGVVGEELAS